MILLTIDTDWAPDPMVKIVLDKVRALGIKTTVFFSTPSPVPYWPELEVGCHPDLSRRFVPRGQADNFMAMASLEEDLAVDRAESNILEGYRQIIPGATAVRTHRFYWHSDLSRTMIKNGFEDDSSMILPFFPGIKGFRVGKLNRWPVWSSDHLHLVRKLPLDSFSMPNFSQPGLKIFCFHVAYLFLNVRNLLEFNMIKKRLDNENETPQGGGGPGIWDFFELLAGQIYKKSPGFWLKDIPEDYVVKKEF
jgi:hypothetical protein